MNILSEDTTKSSSWSSYIFGNDNFENKEASLLREQTFGGTSRSNFSWFSSDKYQPYSRDITYAIIFIINLITILYLSLSYGISAINNSNSEAIVNVNNKSQTNTTYSNDGSIIIGILFITLFMGSILSIFWIYLVSFVSSDIISFSFLSFILLGSIAGIIMFVSKFIFVGTCLMISSLFVFLLFLYVRPKLEFASTTMRIASEAIRSMPATIYVSIFVNFLQIVYCFLWALTMIGMATNESVDNVMYDGKSYSIKQCVTYEYTKSYHIGGIDLTCDSKSACDVCVCDGNIVSYEECFEKKFYISYYLLLLLSLFWSCSVFSNIVHCTTSGSMSAWWSDINTPHSGIIHSQFTRAITESFGSICLGSLVASFIHTIRLVFHFIADFIHTIDSTGSFRGCKLRLLGYMEVFLSILDRTIIYLNKYAFTYLSIYDYTFVESSQAASNLFHERGWTAIVNDDICDTILCLGQGVVGILCMIVALLLADHEELGSINTMILTLYGFFTGWYCCKVTSKCIGSAVNTVYVCYAESPESLLSSHPALYHELCASWKKLYPNRQDLYTFSFFYI